MKSINEIRISQTAKKLCQLVYLAEAGVTFNETNQVETASLLNLLGVESYDKVFAAHRELVRAGLIAWVPEGETLESGGE